MARGEGIGIGGPRQGDFGASYCVCPKCGFRMEHKKGIPCNTYTCPNCKTKLVGE